jgi:hypothetical protein
VTALDRERKGEGPDINRLFSRDDLIVKDIFRFPIQLFSMTIQNLKVILHRAMSGKKAAERFCYQGGALFGSRCSPIKLSDKLIGENDRSLNSHRMYCRVKA